MDLSNLLNQGDPALTVKDLRDLLTKTSQEKKLALKECNFEYPASPQQAYVYFDLVCRLLLSIDYLNKSDKSTTDNLTLTCLRSCMLGLANKFGLTWITSFPHHLDPATWLLLASKHDDAIPYQLYGMVLGIKQRPTVDVDTWGTAIVCFIQMNNPRINKHLWLTLCYLDPTSSHLVPAYMTFLSQRCDTIDFRKTAAEIGNTKLKGFQQTLTRLGASRLKPAFTELDFIMGKSTFHRLLYQPAFAFLKEKFHSVLQKGTPRPPIEDHPLATNLAVDIPVKADDRIALVQLGLDLWQSQAVKLGREAFDEQLNDLLNMQYPRHEQTVLDLVLAQWAIINPYEIHRKIIVDRMIKICHNNNYQPHVAPFYAFLRVFRFAQATCVDSSPDQLLSITDVDTFANYDYTKLIVPRLLTILKQMSVLKMPDDSSWLVDCVQLAPPVLLTPFVAWLIDEANNDQCDGDPLKSSPAYLRLLPIFGSETLPTFASTLVPLLLTRSSDRTISRLFAVGKVKYRANVVGLFNTFFGAPHPDVQVLIQLFETKSATVVKKFISYLQQSGQLRPQTKYSFLVNQHMIQVIVRLAAHRHPLAIELFNDILTAQQDVWLLRTWVGHNGDGDDPSSKPTAESSLKSTLHGKTPSQDGHWLFLVEQHTLVTVQCSGMISLVQAISALPSAASQQALTDCWLDLWTNERRELTITIPCLLKCLGAFACGSVIVKQMMKQLLQAGLASSAPDYLPRLLDMLILSDLPHGAKMLNLLLDQLSDPWIEPVVAHILDTVLVCIEELRLQTMEQRPDQEAMDTSDVMDGTKYDWSELDECLVAEGTKVVAIDARNINVLAYRVLRFLDLVVLDNVATQSPRRQQLRSSLLQQPMLYEPLAHFFSLDTTSPLAKATLARLLQTCLTLVKKENAPVYTYCTHIINRISPLALQDV